MRGSSTSAALVAALMLGGCVYAYPVPVLDPTAQAVGAGAAIGAGAGALIGATGGHAGEGAAVGALVGAVAGYALERERQRRWEEEQAWRYQGVLPPPRYGWW
jgi:membrane associated rhomboid family serine protease